MAQTQNHVLVCCDFDGTMMVEDTGVLLIDECIGQSKRMALDHTIMTGERPTREVFSELWGSVDLPLSEAFEIFKGLELLGKLRPFVEYCFEENIPFVVVSGGLKFIIEYFLKEFFPTTHSKFRIESNLGKVEGRKWTIEYHDDSEFGHDKGRTMMQLQKEYSEQHNGAKPYTIFCGDGVSDLSAARRADLLFARRGRGLEEYCIKHSIPFIPFDDFQIVKDMVAKVKKDGPPTAL